MNIQHLEYFVALAESEHMTKTAKELNTSQPNLSYVIAELERELGLPLFKKDGRNIKLTRYGRIFYTSAKEAIRTIDQAYAVLQAEVHPNQGKLAVGFIYTFGSDIGPNLISQFLQKYPQVHFQLEQNNSHNLLHALSREELDCAIVSKIDHFSQIQFETLMAEEQVIIVPEDHPLAKYDSISLADTIAYDYVYYNEHSGLRPYLDQSFKKLGLQPRIRIELEDDQSVLGFVAHHFGIAIIPNIISIDAYRVKKIKITDTLDERRIYIAYNKSDFYPPIQTAFKEFAKNLLKL